MCLRKLLSCFTILSASAFFLFASCCYHARSCIIVFWIFFDWCVAVLNIFIFYWSGSTQPCHVYVPKFVISIPRSCWADMPQN
jgi:hypothetical protein